MGILVLWPGIKSVPPALAAWTINHWTALQNETMWFKRTKEFILQVFFFRLKKWYMCGEADAGGCHLSEGPGWTPVGPAWIAMQASTQWNSTDGKTLGQPDVFGSVAERVRGVWHRMCLFVWKVCKLTLAGTQDSGSGCPRARGGQGAASSLGPFYPCGFYPMNMAPLQK